MRRGGEAAEIKNVGVASGLRKEVEKKYGRQNRIKTCFLGASVAMQLLSLSASSRQDTSSNEGVAGKEKSLSAKDQSLKDVGRNGIRLREVRSTILGCEQRSS